jgi:DNA-binding protein HU-beta
VTKQEFVGKVASKSGLSQADAAKAVDAFLDSVEDELKNGGQVNFTGFGKFSTSNRAARMGVNPRTGEKVHIAAATVPKFSAGSKLKATVKAGGGGGSY